MKLYSKIKKYDMPEMNIETVVETINKVEMKKTIEMENKVEPTSIFGNDIFKFSNGFEPYKEIISYQECQQCLNEQDKSKFKICVTCQQSICNECNMKNFFKCSYCRRHISSGMQMERPISNIGWDD